MNSILKNSVRFAVLILLQSLVFNQLEIGFGIQIMITPLFVLLMPFDMRMIPLLLVVFAMGLSVDVISNTYGLNASSLLLIAYLRPFIFKLFAPRDGYDLLKEGNSYDMGFRWFIYVYVILLIIHHFWFYTLEVFRLDEFFFILRKTFLSVPFSFGVSLLIQTFLVSKQSKR